MNPGALLEGMLHGNAAVQRRAMSKAITLLESTRADHRAQGDELLTALLPHTGKSFRLGISGVPSTVDLPAVRAWLLSLPGVTRVHDLHIWAMGTSEVALTAHLVMPDGHPQDAFFQNITHELHERFDIEHVTVQVVREPFTQSCAGS